MGKEEEAEEAVLASVTLDISNLKVIVPSDIHVEILEQPAKNGFRFRYQSEGNSIGCLHGETSNGGYKTYPKIKIVGYEGPASVVVSCVEENGPYRAHPHKLVGKNCLQGVCKVDVSPDTDMTTDFPKMGIQCTKRREISKSLALREEIKVDPFKQGFGHMNSKDEMDKLNLDSIRLSFQVFISGLEEWIAVPPTVSNVIRNRNGQNGDLKIDLVSDNEAPIEGGKKILMFTSRIVKKDIEVHFAFNKDNQEHVLKGHMGTNDVHHQCGLSFITPPFPDQKITQKHHAKLYLFRPSDQAASDSIDFYFQPNSQDVENIPIGIRYVKKADRKSHDKNKESTKKEDMKCSGGNVKVEKMESSGMSFTDRVLTLKGPGFLDHPWRNQDTLVCGSLDEEEEEEDIRSRSARISFKEINSVLKIE